MTEGRKKEYTVMAAPFEARSLLRSWGAKWLDGPGVWAFEGPPPREAEMWRCRDFSWEKLVQDSLNGKSAAGGPADTGFSLRPHQEEGRKIIVRAMDAGVPGFLLADEVGLGKTHTAWAATIDYLKKKKGGDVLVVCPLSVVAHWRKALRRQGTGGGRILVMNYDRLQKLFAVPPEKKKKVKTRKGVARSGEPPAFALIIFDEAHKLRNPVSARSKLSTKLAANADFCIWMSATAGQTPLELSYAAPLLAARTGERVTALTKDFEEWCKKEGLGVSKGAFGKWEWDGSKGSREKVRRLLFEKGDGVVVGLRRSPQEIAGWPPIQRIVLPTELSPEERAAYDAAWDDFKRLWGTEGAGFAAKAKKAGKAKTTAAAALVAMLRFRQKASLIRLGGTLDMAEDLLEQGMQVAVSCAFTETAREMRERLEKAGWSCATITGASGADERERERLAFQRGEKEAVVFTVEEGISLHEGEEPGGDKKRVLLIHDPRWSAIQTAQIEGRCHRDGKAAPAYWMLAEDSIEEAMGRRLADRMANTKALSGDDESVADELGRELLRMLDKQD